MNELQKVFDYKNRNVRMVLIDEKPWFVAKDVCEILEIKNVSDTLAKVLDEDEKGIETIYTLGGQQEMSIVNEPGLYSLILRSRKPEAKDFKRWITHDVLPQIRTTGKFSYEEMTRLQILELAVQSEKDRLQLEAKVKVLEPKAEAFDRFIDGKGFYTMESVAKMFGWGRNLFMAKLRDEKIMTQTNMPTSQFIGTGYFKVHASVHNGISCKSTLVSPKGVDYLRKKVVA